MSNVPPDYIKATSFTTLATQPITISGLPGSQMDSEFTNVATSVNQTIDRLSMIQKDDGLLRNGVVGLDSLSVDAKNALAVCGAVVRGTWVASTTYEAGDVVVSAADKYSYLCVTTHTSSADFDADFLSNVWAIMGYRPATNALAVDTFTAGVSQTVYTLSNNPVSENNTQVFINGVYQSKTAYSVSGLTLTLTTAPATGAKVEVVSGVAAELINNIVTIPANSVGTLGIVDLAVTAAKIADATITTEKLADQSVTSAKIQNNTVGSTKITDLSITTDKLAGGSVTTTKLAPGAVIVSNIGDSAVTAEKIAAGAVTTAKIADGSVTTSKIADGAVNQAKAFNMLVPAGAIMPFAMNAAPDGWLQANGAAVSRTTYAALFTAIGSFGYGAGDGSTTFNLPDLRGYFVRGFGTNSDGTVSGTFGLKQGSNVGSHTHSTTVGFNQSNANGSAALSGQPNPADQSFLYTSNNGSQTGETRPANIAMLYCIKI